MENMPHEGINQFEILLDNPISIYAPGETISGKLVIELLHPKKVKALKLRFEGVCTVKRTNGPGLRSKMSKFDRNEVYFQTDLCVLRGTASERIEMTSGHHVFPFTYNLPHKIPSTFQHNIGYIGYSIKAMFYHTWEQIYTIGKHFTIQASFELQLTGFNTRVGIDDHFQKKFHHYLIPCLDEGKISGRCRIPSTVFVCNDTIEATINIDLESSSINVTTITLTLEQVLEFRTIHHIRCRHVTIEKAQQISPFSKTFAMKIYLKVPEFYTSPIKYCSIIKEKYKLNFNIHFSGCHNPIKKIYDVQIIPKLTPLMMSLQKSVGPQISNHLIPSKSLVMPRGYSSASYSVSTDNSSEKLIYPRLSGGYPLRPIYIYQRKIANESPPPSYKSVMIRTKMCI